MAERKIIAVTGKGGGGKTALCALLSRSLLSRSVRPLLLIDADPAGGLVSAIGESVGSTLTAARERLIRSARGADDREKTRLADQLDYFVTEALEERDGYALLAMGHSREKGCYCPANTLLREAIDLVSEPFPLVVIDAEAGLEQINRQVTRRVDLYVALNDGSQRSAKTLELIASMVGVEKVAAVGNRVAADTPLALPEGVKLLGRLPEDKELREFDREGRSLWELAEHNPAVQAAGEIASTLLELWRAGESAQATKGGV